MYKTLEEIITVSDLKELDKDKLNDLQLNVINYTSITYEYSEKYVYDIDTNLKDIYVSMYKKNKTTENRIVSSFGEKYNLLYILKNSNIEFVKEDLYYDTLFFNFIIRAYEDNAEYNILNNKEREIIEIETIKMLETIDYSYREYFEEVDEEVYVKTMFYIDEIIEKLKQRGNNV
jgi:hypothetical protein